MTIDQGLQPKVSQCGDLSLRRLACYDGKVFRLSTNDVHVWHFPGTAEADLCAEVLSQDELERADRFVFERDRLGFISRRSVLRHLLARYLDFRPEEIVFDYNQRGRPSLGRPCCDRQLVFNVSYTDGRVLYAVTMGRAIGVDVECRTKRFPLQDLIGFFSPREVAALSDLPPSLFATAFFRCWTCKEAFAKALGLGLALPFRTFDVQVDPRLPAGLLGFRSGSRKAERWSLADLSDRAEFTASLALQGRDANIQIRELTCSPSTSTCTETLSSVALKGQVGPWK